MITQDNLMNTRQIFDEKEENSVSRTIIAHRGASGHAPENTLASINKARELGVHYIEIDVRLTKDKVPVVLHDPHLKGVHPKKAIRDISLSEARQHDVGSWFHPNFAEERIPTLTEALESHGKTSPLMVEIKRDIHGPKTIANAVFDTITDGRDLWNHMVIGSFSHQILHYMQQHIKNDSQHLPIELIGIADKPEQINPFLDMGIQRLALWHKLITPALMKHLNAKKIPVWVFTVNTPELAHKLTKMGVHGLITNFPEKI